MNRYILGCIAAAALTLNTACTDDLNQFPHNETTSEQVYTNVQNYEAVLGKIYASMTATGQESSGVDYSSNHGENYMRTFLNLQEGPTDEMAYTWLTGDDMTNISFMKWDANDTWVSDMYYRIYYNITLCNEFLRNCSDSKISSFGDSDQQKLRRYKAEARFMRALFYYHALDLFRNIPFVTENDPIGTYVPPRYTPQQTFEYVESELKDCVSNLASKDDCPYGEASKGAAYTLLAKLYLNAETYIGTAKYTECIEACNNAIAQGYSLNADYAQLFNADNDKRTNEIIFALPVNAEHTVSWGASTYLVCGQLSMSNAKQKVADYGVANGWSSFRLRPEFVDKFAQADINGTGDKRCKFFTDGQSKDLSSMTDETAGYLSQKWSNVKDDGSTASNTAKDGVETDFPLFRLADVYLMYAEAVVRTNGDWDNWAGGTDANDPAVIASRKQGAIYWINKLRERAGNSDVWASSFADNDALLQFILDERARELYHEGYRRTDLIRYDMFTTNKYIWQWKGGSHDGKAVDSKYNYYPIPNTELTANPNLHNEGY